MPLRLISLCLLFLIPLSAQDSATPPPKAIQVDTTGAAPSVEDLKESLSEVQGDENLEAVAKEAIAKRYADAIEFAEAAAGNRENEALFRSALEQGNAPAQAIQEEIDALKEQPASPPIDPKSPREELEGMLRSVQAELAALESQKEDLESQLDAFRARPDIIRTRLSEAKTELAEATAKAMPPANGEALAPGEKATRDRLAAQRRALSTEIAMLEQEDRSAEIRRALTERQKELTDLKINRAETRLESLRKIVSAQVQDEADEATRLIARMREATPPPSPAVEAALVELEKLVTETRQVTRSIQKSTEETKLREKQQAQLATSLKTIQGQFAVGARASSLSAQLLEQMRTLPKEWESRQRIRQIQTKLAEARSKLYDWERVMQEEEKSSDEALQVAPHLEQDWKKLVGSRGKMLIDLRTNYERWIRDLGAQYFAEESILDTSNAFRLFAREKLFWVRSSSILFSGSLSDLFDGISYVVGWRQLRGLASHLSAIPTGGYALFGLILAIVAGATHFFRRRLRQIATDVRHFSSDRFSLTVLAIVYSALIAIPFPFLLFGSGLGLAISSPTSEWITSLGTAMINAAPTFYFLVLLLVICEEGGIGDIHFRWEKEMLRRTRKITFALVPIYLAASISLSLVESEATAAYLGNLGRVILLFEIICGGLLFALLMHPNRGIAAAAERRFAGSIFGKLRIFWFRAILFVLAVLCVLLFAGYVYTTLLLTEQIQKSLIAVVLAFLLFGLIFRWFAIRERKAARAEAIAKQREALALRLLEAQGADEESQAPAQNEMDLELPEEAEKLDLDEVKDQTRRFVGFLIGILLLWQLYSIWAQFDPLVGFFSTFTLAGLTLVEITFTILVVTVVVSTVRNLPGILDILVLRRTKLDSGTQNAVITLAKYTVIAVGALVLFRNLGVDWSQFGWIAAALSVGLGFGLQEVVANFVSGIILLFERPIRVGDVVTIDGTDGKVTKIQIRATTITNWDRKEFIVPNKQFITGTLMNWTRGNSINRITIQVGVAYGSDTKLAREILLAIAADHPRLMEDPAPIASFEGFGSSTLDLMLRCYLPDMEDRLGVITDLHSEIDRRFKEAGIEIAFPQLDIHVKMENPEALHPKEG